MNGPPARRWLSPDRRVPLAGDASNRTYWRLVARGGETAIRADYPEGASARIARDVAVLGWLAGRGVRVPSILFFTVNPPVLIVEDFGPDDAEASLRRAGRSRRRDLAERLLGPLIQLAAIPPGDLPPFNPPLDEGRLRSELADFERWYVSARCGLPVAGVLHSWLDELAGAVGSHPRRVCHRDYHLNNLFVLADGEVGVIDVQDAFVGPDTYDLASLIGERAFPELVDRAGRRRLAKTWAERTGAETGWEMRLEQTLLQRGLKVLGTFSRLEASGKQQYERWVEPLARRLAAAARRAGAPHELEGCLLYSRADGGSYAW
ncbi:MAG: phosphotransferase [Acidobacteria bacterium]|nr:phosphotransferase [Acidobacteriota bacterium]